jgi:L-rhamnose mutarotase
MPQRIGMVTGIRPEKLEEYKALHANPPQGVLDGLRRAHVSNYSIFVHGTTLFGYLEYDGDDFDRDLAELAKDPVTQQWWSLTDPCQFRLPDGDPDSQWTTAESVFFMA